MLLACARVFTTRSVQPPFGEKQTFQVGWERPAVLGIAQPPTPTTNKTERQTASHLADLVKWGIALIVYGKSDEARREGSRGERVGRRPEMSQKSYITVTGAVFFVIAVLHLLRLLLGWGAVIGGWNVPSWVSCLALVLSGYLAYSAFKLSK